MTLAIVKPFAKAAALISLTFLGGCTSAPWEEGFWTPPAATGAVPIPEGQAYPMRRAEGNFDSWPNLSAVPERESSPKDPAQQAAELQELEADRSAARSADAALRARGSTSTGVSSPGAVVIPAAPPVVPPEVTE